MLWVSEHGCIFKGDNNLVMPDGDVQLKSSDFTALLSLLEDHDGTTPDYESVFTYMRPHGRECLKVQNFVGVIRTENCTQIEILPKLAKHADVDAARALLVKMLMHLEDSPFREGTVASLEAHRMPLFELLMRYFLDHVVEIVRKGIARTYVAHKDNLVYLRGKLALTEHIRRNSINSARCYCEHDEYEANRPINRLIKGALVIVSRLTNDAMNQQRCRELLFWFDAVPPTESPALDFQQMQRDRLIQHYAPAMPTCRLILEGLNPLTKQGERKAISMLFPMEKVFEDFVAAKLLHQFESWDVSAQVRGQALVQRHIKSRIFNLIPDLQLRRGGVRLIADTKWKLIDESDHSGKYRISQGDIYQLFAYAKKYLTDQAVREVYLIYPASDTFRKPLRAFWYEESKEVLYVVPYDLEAEKLIIPSGSSLVDQKLGATA